MAHKDEQLGWVKSHPDEHEQSACPFAPLCSTLLFSKVGRHEYVVQVKQIKNRFTLSVNLFLFYVQQILKLHGQGIADAVEGVVNLLAEGGHHSDYDNGDERENDRVLNETLAFFFRSK